MRVSALCQVAFGRGDARFLGGVILGSATTNGAIASSLAEYGGEAAVGLNFVTAVVGGISTSTTSDTILKRAFRSEQDRFLRKSVIGFSVHIGATDEQISAHLKGEILTVSYGEVQDLQMALIKTPGTIPELDPYHHEIVQGPTQTWNQFKNALKSLLWRK